ncbi:MAG: hypothetical protein ACP5JR_02035 [Thermoplasmata archaeon]
MDVKEEHEVRIILHHPDNVLACARNTQEYTLVDTYFLPNFFCDFWRPETRNLRLRKFGDREAEIILSVPRFRGFIKYGKKYFLARGKETLLAEAIREMGFREAFQIRRKHGYFLDYFKWNIALEEIDGLGWMIDADVECEADANFLLEQLGKNVLEILRIPLPAYYCKTFNIQI